MAGQDKSTKLLTDPTKAWFTYEDANQLLTAGANTYTYDANGNRASKMTVNGTVYYAYDYRNLLTGTPGQTVPSLTAMTVTAKECPG